MSKVRKWIMEERSDSKDPAIKLFGKTIPVPIHAPDEVECRVQELEEEGVVDELASSGSNSNGRRDSEKLVITGKEKNSTSETENEGKPKRPDKPVPCPRCDSLDTKFCYYNNYNINQPRHFCKNCQRYWTAGGSLRNVPVGAGRRKNKSSNHHHHHHHQWHHLFQHQAMDVAIDSQQQQQQDMMIVQELSPTRSIATHNSKTANVPPAAPTFHHLAATGAGLLSDSTNNSDVTSGSVCGSSPCNKNDKGMEGSASNPDHLTTWTGMGMPPGAAAMWGMQWAALAAVAAAAASTNSSPPGQALLGKRHATGDDDGHGDDGSDVKSGCLWVPKTLRIDDAAARSSIWNALGVDRGCAASEASSSKIGMQDAGKISN